MKCKGKYFIIRLTLISSLKGLSVSVYKSNSVFSNPISSNDTNLSIARFAKGP